MSIPDQVFELKAERPYDFFDPNITTIVASMPGLQLYDKFVYFPREGYRLNVGCGSYLANWMFQCEVNSDLKERKLWKNFIQADVLDIGNMFEPKTFDYTFSAHLFEHLTIADIVKASQGLERISKKVIILVPQGEHFLGQIFNDHLTLFLEEGLAQNKIGEISPISTVQ